MNKKQMSKRQRDIKSKLMAAVAMLLVSSIMMVSTTYAWFTLSTAPEVTGISTAVGANGNLEMALLPVDGGVTSRADYGITSDSGDSMAVADATVANVTWGNLVDLGAKNGTENAYGLDKIKLYPAAMNETAAGHINTEIFLKTPIYGADGRVSNVTPNTATGVYAGGSFQQSVVKDSTTVDAPTGVRAIGTVSNMSQQQVDFRAAMSTASGMAVRAQDAAKAALIENGDKLAEIAIKHYKGKGTETYTAAEVAPLKAMTSALLEDDGAIDLLEQAIVQYVWAYVVATDANYESQRNDIINTTDIETLLNKVPSDSVLATMITKLVVNVSGPEGSPDGGTKGKTDRADKGLATLTSESNDWNTVSTYLNELANMNGILLNGKTMDQATSGEIMGAVLNGNLTLTLPTGSGVFADIADHAGDYGASISIDAGIYEADLAGNMIKAAMRTQTTVADGGYQAQAKAVLSEIPIAGNDATSAAITDYYGYVIDLAFRTNAAGSYLQLQSNAVDRIYTDPSQKDNTTEETMGHGSTMTFKGAGSFQDANVLELMKHIRLVFFNPTNGEIYAYGYLDETTVDYSNGVTMNLHLSSTNPKTDVTAISNDQIMALNQNQAHRLSVLVYLDGETVTNKDVAFDSAMSMTGSINLQFSSSATLVPMDYSGLASIKGNDTPGTTTPSLPDGTVDVTVTSITDGYAVTGGKGLYTESLKTVAVQITANADGPAVTTGTVTINGAPATYNAQGGWTATLTEAPSNLTIEVSA